MVYGFRFIYFAVGEPLVAPRSRSLVSPGFSALRVASRYARTVSGFVRSARDKRRFVRTTRNPLRVKFIIMRCTHSFPRFSPVLGHDRCVHEAVSPSRRHKPVRPCYATKIYLDEDSRQRRFTSTRSRLAVSGPSRALESRVNPLRSRPLDSMR